MKKSKYQHIFEEMLEKLNRHCTELGRDITYSCGIRVWNKPVNVEGKATTTPAATIELLMEDKEGTHRIYSYDYTFRDRNDHRNRDRWMLQLYKLVVYESVASLAYLTEGVYRESRDKREHQEGKAGLRVEVQITEGAGWYLEKVGDVFLTLPTTKGYLVETLNKVILAEHCVLVDKQEEPSKLLMV